jgi:hypothetical protein
MASMSVRAAMLAVALAAAEKRTVPTSTKLPMGRLRRRDAAVEEEEPRADLPQSMICVAPVAYESDSMTWAHSRSKGRAMTRGRRMKTSGGRPLLAIPRMLVRIAARHGITRLKVSSCASISAWRIAIIAQGSGAVTSTRLASHGPCPSGEEQVEQKGAVRPGPDTGRAATA